MIAVFDGVAQENWDWSDWCPCSTVLNIILSETFPCFPLGKKVLRLPYISELRSRSPREWQGIQEWCIQTWQLPSANMSQGTFRIKGFQMIPRYSRLKDPLLSLCYPFVIYCALFSSNFQLLNSLQVPVISGDLLQNQRQAQPHSKTLSVHLGAAGSLWVMQCICIICICIICIRFDAMPIAMAKLLSEIPNERTE